MTAHKRSGPETESCSVSSSASRFCRFAITRVCCLSAHRRQPSAPAPWLGIGSFGFVFGRGLFDIFSLDPAGMNASGHDHVFDVRPRQLEAVEEALVPDGLGVLFLLALGPADELVGRAVGKVFDGLDAVFAERDHHRGRDAGNFRKLIGNAKLTTLRVALGFLLLEIFAGAALDLLRRVLVKTFDVRNFRRDRRRRLPRSSRSPR